MSKHRMARRRRGKGSFLYLAVHAASVRFDMNLKGTYRMPRYATSPRLGFGAYGTFALLN